MSGYTFTPPPALNGSNEQKILQVYSYLFRMNEQLSYTLNNLTPENFAGQTGQQLAAVVDGSAAKQEAAQQYDTLKSLVVKTADVVRHEMDMLETELASKYLAISEFGKYQEDMTAQIRATAEGIIQQYGFQAQLDDLGSSADAFDSYIVKTDQYIKTGLLYYEGTVPRYGVAVGENLTTVEVDGQQVLTRNNLCATFTSDRLSFWMGGVEVAYVSNNKLYIANAEITGQLITGNWRISHEGGFTVQWIGG